MMPNGGHEMRFCLERSNRCAPQEYRAPQVHRQPVEPHRQRWQTIIERILTATNRDHGLYAVYLLIPPALQKQRPVAPLTQAPSTTPTASQKTRQRRTQGFHDEHTIPMGHGPMPNYE